MKFIYMYRIFIILILSVLTNAFAFIDNNNFYYGYDAAGNRISERATGSSSYEKTYQHNQRHQITRIENGAQSIDFSYDARGNLIEKRQAGQVRTFEWNTLNQLQAIRDNGQPIGQYRYDGEGLRIEKVTAQGTKRTGWVQGQAFAEYDEQNQLTARYERAQDERTPLVRLSTTGHEYLHTDALGSVTETTAGNQAGSLQSRNEYAAFGSAEHTGTTQNTLGFTGHEQDQESGLWYAKARYYDSELGRFISRDAFEGHGNLPASWQAYQYAYNNPMVWIDPSGNYLENLDEVNYYLSARKTCQDGNCDLFQQWKALSQQRYADLSDCGSLGDCRKQVERATNAQQFLANREQALIEGKVNASVGTAEQELFLLGDMLTQMNHPLHQAGQNIVSHADKEGLADTLTISEANQRWAGFIGLAALDAGAMPRVLLVNGNKSLSNAKIVKESDQLGIDDFSSGINLKVINNTPSTVASSKPSPGVIVERIGNYWVKTVDENANIFLRIYGSSSIKAQAKGLKNLENIGTTFLYKNKKIITRDAGSYTPGNFMNIWYQGSKKLGTPFNDIRPRNIGQNGIIFDPSKIPAHQYLEKITFGSGIGTLLYMGYESRKND